MAIWAEDHLAHDDLRRSRGLYLRSREDSSTDEPAVVRWHKEESQCQERRKTTREELVRTRARGRKVGVHDPVVPNHVDQVERAAERDEMEPGRELVIDDIGKGNAPPEEEGIAGVTLLVTARSRLADVTCLRWGGHGAEVRLVNGIHVLWLVEACSIVLAAANSALHEGCTTRRSRRVEVLLDLDIGHVGAADGPDRAIGLDPDGSRDY